MKRKASDQEIIEAYNSCPSLRSAARQVGLNYSSFRERCKKLGLSKKDRTSIVETFDSCEVPEVGIKASMGSKQGWIELTGYEMPTAEEVLEKYNLDPRHWKITRMIPNQWQGFYKKDSFEKIPGSQKHAKVANGHSVVTMHSLKIHIERVVSEEIVHVMERLSQNIPALPATEKAKPSGKQTAVFGLYDAHIGSLCWEGETDQNNDLTIAKVRCRGAIDDMISELKKYPIGKIIIPVGNDFCHIDNQQGTTSSGTQLDFDSRYARVIEVCHDVLAYSVDSCLDQGWEVQILWVGGNHDWVTSLHMTHWLKQRYRDNTSVSVDTRAHPRKYVYINGTLLGFAHGDRLKPSDVYRHMAEEAKMFWSRAVCREFHTGDKHHRKQIDQTSIDTFGKVTFRQNPTLAPRDSWTVKMGFDSVRCADAYRYSEEGFVGLHTCYARV